MTVGYVLGRPGDMATEMNGVRRCKWIKWILCSSRAAPLST
jgi:hypothetical protein